MSQIKVFEKNKIDLAEKWITQAYIMEPSEPEIIDHLSQIYLKLNRIQNNNIEQIVENIQITKEETEKAVKELEAATVHKSKFFWIKTATVGVIAGVAGIPLSSIVGIKVASSMVCGSVITSLFL